MAAASTSVKAWRRRTAAGAVLTGVALGMRQALEEPRERPAIVVEASDQPFWPPRPIELRFISDAPAQTWAVVRPWLLEIDER